MYDPFARLFHMDPLQNRKNRFTFYITTKQGRSYIMGHRAMAPAVAKLYMYWATELI